MSCASAVPRKATHWQASAILGDCLATESPRPLNIDALRPDGPTGVAAMPTSTSSFAKVLNIQAPCTAMATAPEPSWTSVFVASEKVP